MRGVDALRLAIVFAVLVVLHYLLRPFLGWRASPDFLMIGLLLVAIRVRTGTAAILGFLIGIVEDSLQLRTFGASAFALSVVGFAASWMKGVFFADDLWLNGFFLFLGKLAYELLYVIAAHDGSDVLLRLMVWAPLSAAVTAGFGMLTVLVMRPILRTTPT
ncbi:MAG: rod shape-determining protein MreD [Gemmatimonadaceae bacterium]